jgi:hypothetical protein
LTCKGLPALPCESRLGQHLFAAYASRHGYALVDKRLFMPEAWYAETSAARRTKCEVPEDVRFQTKPQ